MIDTPDAEMWTYEMVETRLVEALLCARRVSDREAGWLRLRAWWPDVVRATWLGDYGGDGVDGASAVRVRPLPLTREQIAQMRETEGWLGRYLDEDARRLVLLALGFLAAGRRIGWLRIGRATRVRVSAEALRRRYIEALARIACGLACKGEASVRQMVRQRLMSEARRAAGEVVPVNDRKRGQRRRIRVADIVYSD